MERNYRVWPTAREEPRPASVHMSERGGGFASFSQAVRRLQSSQQLDCNLVRTCEPEPPAKPFLSMRFLSVR